MRAWLLSGVRSYCDNIFRTISAVWRRHHREEAVLRLHVTSPINPSLPTLITAYLISNLYQIRSIKPKALQQMIPLAVFRLEVTHRHFPTRYLQRCRTFPKVKDWMINSAFTTQHANGIGIRGDYLSDREIYILAKAPPYFQTAPCPSVPKRIPSLSRLIT